MSQYQDYLDNQFILAEKACKGKHDGNKEFFEGMNKNMYKEMFIRDIFADQGIKLSDTKVLGLVQSMCKREREKKK